MRCAVGVQDSRSDLGAGAGPFIKVVASVGADGGEEYVGVDQVWLRDGNDPGDAAAHGVAEHANAIGVYLRKVGGLDSVNPIDNIFGIAKTEVMFVLGVGVGGGVIAIIRVEDGVAAAGKVILFPLETAAIRIDGWVDIAMVENQERERTLATRNVEDAGDSEIATLVGDVVADIAVILGEILANCKVSAGKSLVGKAGEGKSRKVGGSVVSCGRTRVERGGDKGIFGIQRSFCLISKEDD